MKGRYIIFADDDADDLELITSFFKEYNQRVEVLEFKDGKEVVKFLEEVSIAGSLPVLMVLDINMPKINGMETLAFVRKTPALQNIPVLIYTTASDSASEQLCKKHNASWVVKPDHIDEVKKVAKIIADFCHLI
ncbi:MAG: response regulator [Flavisolibacter sp.]